ncbi:MAG: hypothetical protein A3H95_16100 [Acidobacteria bacterium RIFCSPLOWO2_02_FULL_64_15]|nr:MAG: hypothetical protein A3H95_16100 [Acidobacteria bacterium RIFCSPLOWO2_02_FULL_64_15]
MLSQDAGIQAVLDDVRTTIDRLGWVDEGERDYFDEQRRRYEFTLGQISALVGSGAAVLDVGSHLLHFSMAATAIGHAVSCADVAYFVDLAQNHVRQKECGISEARVCDLANQPLPYDDRTFDVLNFSEALEHLNFNPLPVIKEFCRVLRPGGVAIVTTPNALRLGSRLRLLRGQNVFADLHDLCWGQSFGIHHREYTLGEVAQLLEWGGFGVVVRQTAYLYPDNGLRRIAKVAVSTLAPSLGGNLFVVGKKP